MCLGYLYHFYVFGGRGVSTAWPPPWGPGPGEGLAAGRQRFPQAAPWSSISPGPHHTFEDEGMISLQKAASTLSPVFLLAAH